MTTPQSNPLRNQFAGKLAGKRLLITTSSFGAVDPAPLDFLRSTGCDIELNPHGRKLTESECGTLYAARDAVLAGTEKITAGLLEENRRRLKVISRCGVGLDSVDLDAAARLGIEVRDYTEAIPIFAAGGAIVDGTRVRFPRGLCRQIVSDNAPATYVQHARNPANSVVIGGDNTVFAPNYG